MKVQITGRHMELSSALKQRVDTELAQMERFHENIVYADVTFSEEKVGNSVTLDMKVWGDVLTVTAKGENPFAALELASDKMKRRLKDYKTRLKERKRQAAPTREAVDQMKPPEPEE